MTATPDITHNKPRHKLSGREIFQNRVDELGLSPIEVEILGLEYLTPIETARLFNWLNPDEFAGSILIPYFTIERERTDYYRLRLLEHPNPDIKYLQPPNSEVRPYLSPLNDSIERFYASRGEDDPYSACIITEGEFKAIAASRIQHEGHYTPSIGLGGVDSFTSLQSRLDGMNALREFAQIPRWSSVFIVFDADPLPNANVAQAQLRLYSVLSQRFCKVYFVDLKEPGYAAKLGLDDYIQHYGVDALVRKLAASFKASSAIKDELTQLLVDYAVIGGKIENLKTGHVWSKADFELMNSNRVKFTDDGSGKKKPLPITKEFFSSKYRLTLQGRTLNPECQSIISPNNDLNYWRGIRTKPKPGNISHWHEFTDLFFQDDADLKLHFEKWVACCLQRPGHKQYIIPIVRSRLTGVGKSLYFEVPVAIYNGGYSAMASSPPESHKFFHASTLLGESLFGNFNSVIMNKVYLVLNELGEVGVKYTNHLKDLSTSPTLRIEAKFMDAYQQPNLLNFAITSNASYTHQIDPDGRRELVYEVSDRLGIRLRKWFEDFKETNELGFADWCYLPDTLGAIYAHYLELPLRGYDGRSPAPASRAKDRMALASLREDDLWLLGYPFGEIVVLEAAYDDYTRATQPNGKWGKAKFKQVLKDKGFIDAPVPVVLVKNLPRSVMVQPSVLTGDDEGDMKRIVKLVADQLSV